jgi:hypothetical protein
MHSKTRPADLPAARLFNRLNNYSFRLVAGKIGNGQMSDGFTPTGFCFGINENLGNLYRDARRASINDGNLRVSLLGQDITS